MIAVGYRAVSVALVDQRGFAKTLCDLDCALEILPTSAKVC
jgi:hypothetical protein